MKFLELIGKPDFWRGLVISVLAVVVVWLYLQNRSLLHDARVESCRADQELSRKIFTTAADLGVPLSDRRKFIPTENCDSLP